MMIDKRWRNFLRGKIVISGFVIVEVVHLARPVRAQTVTNNDNSVYPYLLNSGTAVDYTNNGAFNVIYPSSIDPLYLISISSSGTNGNSSGSANAGSGGLAQALTVANYGNLSADSTFDHPGIFVGLNVLSLGGAGGNSTNSDSKYNGGNGGAAYGAITAQNIGGIQFTGNFMNGLTGFQVMGVGGNGGTVTPSGYKGNNASTPEFSDHGVGGTGGAGGGITLKNFSAILAGSSTSALQGGGSFIGLNAVSIGGASGLGEAPLAGGNGGQITVSNSGAIQAWWNWAGGGSASAGIYGVQAVSTGGAAANSYQSKQNGGVGGIGGQVSVTLTKGGNIQLNSLNSDGTVNQGGAGIFASSQGGLGGESYDSSTGGTGGSTTGGVTVSLTDAGVSVQGDYVKGIHAQTMAGNGGAGVYEQDHSEGGNGGNAGQVVVTLDSSTLPVGVTTSGTYGHGIIAQSVGGNGGIGADYEESASSGTQAGKGGNGGLGGAVEVGLDGASSVATSGNYSTGILLNSVGGNGGNGGAATVFAPGGTTNSGGNGGNAGSVSLFVATSGSITVGSNGTATSQTQAYGIFAQSAAGNGGAGGSVSATEGTAGNGGVGGNSGDVYVGINPGASVTASDEGASGIVAQSISGSGGEGGQAYGEIEGKSGSGGVGGNTGTVNVYNGGSVQISGLDGRGILAQGLTGVGGQGGSVNGTFYSGGGSGGSSGTLELVVVDNEGTVKTSGQNAVALEALSVNGGGGAGGAASSVIVGIGGSGGSSPGNGGSVEIDQSGTVSTSGDSALGLLAISVGGGGGDAGSSSGVVSIGGSGGAGGAGGVVTLKLTAGSITTSGDLAHAVVAQAIGGGGGNGGYASALGFGISVAVGGSGGDGGAGGAVNVSQSGTITTEGTKSAGLVAQSIGGGGGAGGAGYALTVGEFLSIGVAVGGSGGKGGNGNTVAMTTTDSSIQAGFSPAFSDPQPSNALPVDSYGIVVQSIGGGGGIGGSASAQAVNINVPIPEVGFSGSLAVTSSVGGTGGSGGSGGEAILSLSSNTSVTTEGQGAHAVIVQSIGGGGGIGGDSSSSSTTLTYGRATGVPGNPFNTNLALSYTQAIGGSGGTGGAGGEVNVAVGGIFNSSTNSFSSTGAATIDTYGDYADGIVAQSIGGGGGNAGFGSSTTQNVGTTSTATVNLGIGGSGGSGNNGGEVNLTIFSNSTVNTYGSGSVAVFAQSIGGGGGASQGGSYNLGGSFGYKPSSNVPVTVNPAASATLNIGNRGASGSSGGMVIVDVQGKILTVGGDATGVLAQSIGGGGGLGGSAGSDASADNPAVLYGSGVREYISELVEVEAPFTLTGTLSFGGTGGSGANGGTVQVTLGNSATTQGDWAQGIVAQSIGGGGGKGGTAAAHGTGAIPNITLNLAVSATGGSGGAGGNGGNVSVYLDPGAVISTGHTANGVTTGYGAFGIFAQSLGGGGGMAMDGSDQAIGVFSLGGTTGGNGGAGGGGGAVNVAGSGTITTLGQYAHGIVLQSIGGGGGMNGAGSSLFGGVSVLGGSVSLTVGGGSASEGNGSTVTIGNSPSYPSTVLDITTSGASAYGILAQSVGGGGGLAVTQSAIPTTLTIGGASTQTNSGGAVNINLDSGSSITTSGTGSHALVAQSIGGGGGVALVAGAGDAPVLSTTTAGTRASHGSGGQVSVGADAAIKTIGAGAYGILAQSIGSGGGLANLNGAMFAGSSGAYGSSGSGGTVSVTQIGSISVTGANSVGIFAQSVGANGGQQISITQNGTVSGGSGAQGTGVWMDGGNGSNSLVIGSAGVLGAASGQAVQYTGGGFLNVFNSGQVTGSVNLTNSNGDVGSFNNQGGGVWNTGPTVAADVVNQGVISVGGRNSFGRTTITGNLNQSPSGLLQVNTDFAAVRGDLLTVQGDAVLNGKIQPLSNTILPHVEVPVLTVQGTTIGALAADNSQSAIFQYDVIQRGNQVNLTVGSADFSPRDLGLSANALSVANHFQSIWNAGGNTAFGGIFADLDKLAVSSPDAYGTLLNQLSPGASLSFGARGLADSIGFGNAVLNGPVFEGDTAELSEVQSSWARMYGRTASQHTRDGFSDFTQNNTIWQVGGQWETAPDWFLGGSLGYQYNWMNSDDKNISGDGHTGLAAVTLKHQMERWTFSEAITGSAGWLDVNRSITVPGFQSNVGGSPTVQTVGGVVRAVYDQTWGKIYLRPMLTLNGIYARSGSYNESGAGPLSLNVKNADQATFVATPALEFGTRSDLAPNASLRTFILGGVSFLSNDSWEQRARFAGAPAGAGDFVTSIPMDDIAGRITAGWQLQTSPKTSLFLQYEGEYSANLIGNGGSFGVKYEF